MIKKILFFFTLSLISVSSFAAQLKITTPWVREAPPTARNLAGYVELSNQSDKTIVVNEAKSPLFAQVQLHVTTFVNGMMRMTEIKELKIAPGETVTFEPGGRHFMLMKPKQAIKAGLDVPVELSYTDGTTQVIHFIVRK